MENILILLSKEIVRLPSGKTRSKGTYKCFCGNVFTCMVSSVHQNLTKSCGCFQKDSKNNSQFKHGLTGTHIYNTYMNMQQRCNNPKYHNYKYYGGRGIIIDPGWTFEAFKDWSYLNGYNKNLTIDRIDNNLGYSPSNCRWTSMLTQANNRRKRTDIEITGVRTSGSKWVARISINGKNKYLGSFITKEEAAIAYEIALKSKLNGNIV